MKKIFFLVLITLAITPLFGQIDSLSSSDVSGIGGHNKVRLKLNETLNQVNNLDCDSFHLSSNGDTLTIYDGGDSLKLYAGGGGGGSYTFQDGLTESGGTVSLGGTLTSGISVELNDNSFEIRNNEGSNAYVSFLLGADEVDGASILTIGTGEHESIIYGDTSSIILQHTSGAKTKTYNLNGNNGLVEDSDFSGDYDDRTLVAKSYVDGLDAALRDSLAVLRDSVDSQNARLIELENEGVDTLGGQGYFVMLDSVQLIMSLVIGGENAGDTTYFTYGDIPFETSLDETCAYGWEFTKVVANTPTGSPNTSFQLRKGASYRDGSAANMLTAALQVNSSEVSTTAFDDEDLDPGDYFEIYITDDTGQLTKLIIKIYGKKHLKP